MFSPRDDDSHCDRIHCFLTAVCCFDNSYVGKQSVDWEDYCAAYGLKELQESMGRYTGSRNIVETALNTIQTHKIQRKKQNIRIIAETLDQEQFSKKFNHIPYLKSKKFVIDKNNKIKSFRIFLTNNVDLSLSFTLFGLI